VRRNFENSGVSILPARKDISRGGRHGFATVAMVTALGCHASEKSPPPLPKISEPLVTERVLPPHAESTLVTHGRLPLVYMVQGTGTLRFTDMTSGVNLAHSIVQPRQIVRIDARRGVMIGETALRPGALNTDHEYGIWLDPEINGGALRNAIGRQAPAAPSTQPKSK
jgi:hypothetical protein